MRYKRKDWIRTALICLFFFLLWLAVEIAHATPRPIQGQGSSPYCLFAVAGYLADVDMWELETAYHRQNLPTIGQTPTNNHIFALLRDSYGITLKAAKQWDSEAARRAVQSGKPVAASGRGHAIVLLSWSDTGWITYIDSLYPGMTLTQKVSTFEKWSDGWYWWRP